MTRAGVVAVVCRVAVLSLSLFGAGCGGGGKKSSTGEAAPTLAISVTAGAQLNGGRPVHAVMRTVTLKQFVEDAYADVAALVVNPDESVVTGFVVFPDTARTVTIDKPADAPIAIYFLFTGASGTSWKRLYREVPAAIDIELGTDSIVKPATSR